MRKRLKTRIFVCYTLRASDECEPFYVGKTFLGSNRLSNHIYTSKYSNTSKSSKIKAILSRNAKIIVDILFQSNNELEVFEYEKQSISEYGRKDLGTGILCNHTNGGEGHSGYKQSKKTIRKRRASRAKSKTIKNWPSLSKEVSVYDTNGDYIKTFPSCQEASRQLNIDYRAIGKVANNKNRSAGDLNKNRFQFKFGSSKENIGSLPVRKYRSVERNPRRDN